MRCWALGELGNQVSFMHIVLGENKEANYKWHRNESNIKIGPVPQKTPAQIKKKKKNPQGIFLLYQENWMW